MLDLDKPQIMALFDFDVAVSRIHDAYVASAQGNVQTGDIVHLAFPEANGDCHIKSGHIAGTASYVIKIASGFYDNPAKGLSSSNGMMLAFSANTGEPLAILRVLSQSSASDGMRRFFERSYPASAANC